MEKDIAELERLAKLNNHLGNHLFDEDEAWGEYNLLQEIFVEKYKDLMSAMVKAGFFKVSLWSNDQSEFMSGMVEEIGLNGGFDLSLSVKSIGIHSSHGGKLINEITSFLKADPAP